MSIVRTAFYLPILIILATPFLRAQSAESAPTEEETTRRRFIDEAIEDAGIEMYHISIHGHLNQGFTFNPDSPNDHQNFGRLFDDRANDYRFNQFLLTFERDFQNPSTEWDWGFKAQFMEGTDARFIHLLGITDRATNFSVEPAVTEFFAKAHVPWPTEGGIDVRGGVFTTLLGYEVIDASANPLYSHNYIFNFGVPAEHLGMMVTTHLTDEVAIHTGFDRGINTGFDDNNDAVSFQGGVSLTLFDGKWTPNIYVHYGPENDTVQNRVAGIDANDDARTIVSFVSNLKIADDFVWGIDAVYGQDDAKLGLDGQTPEWYGVTNYFIYTLNPHVDLIARLEYFRDDDGFAVAQFAENDDLVDLERGSLNHIDARTVGGGATSYYEITLGATWRPIGNIEVKGEVRYDFSDGSVKPFDDSSDDDQFSAALSLSLYF